MLLLFIIFKNERQSLVLLRKSNHAFQNNLDSFIRKSFQKHEEQFSNILNSFENSLQAAQDVSANLRQINGNLLQMMESMRSIDSLLPFRISINSGLP